jgi:hypothetical protein
VAEDTVNAVPGDSSARGAFAATRSCNTPGVPRSRSHPLREAAAHKCGKHRQARVVQHSEGHSPSCRPIS